MVENYIKTIHEFHNRQKALRLKRNLDLQNFSRLSRVIKDQLFQSNEQIDKVAEAEDKKSESESKPINKIENFLDSEEGTAEEEYHCSPEELRIFKTEGNCIYDEMNAMNNEVK